MPSVSNIRATLFNVLPGEERPAGLLWLLSFFIGFTMTFYGTAASALFLADFEVESLSYVYILSAITSIVAGYAYDKLQKRFGLSRLMFYTYGCILLSVVAFYTALELAPATSKWIAMGLFVWKDVLFALTGLVFWTLASNTFDLRQGKRLFGLIDSGKILAGLISGLLTPSLVNISGTNALLLYSGFALLGSIILLSFIKSGVPASVTVVEGFSQSEQGLSLPSLLKNKYIVLYFAMGILSLLVYYLIDYAFYDRMGNQFPEEDQLAGFMGMYYAVLAVVTIISNTVLSSRLLVRYGISVGIIAVPIVLMIGTGTLTLVGTLLDLPLLFFGLTILLKVIDEVLRTSLEYPAHRVLYQPLPTNLRLKMQTLAEGFVSPTGSALSGVALLVITSLLELDIVHVFFAILLFLVAWILSSVLLRKEYVRMLVNALHRRRFEGRLAMTLDRSSLDILRKSLHSSNSGEVIYAMNMLEEMEYEGFTAELETLLDHPKPEVRLECLNRIDRHKIKSAIPKVKSQINANELPRVRGAALKTLMALGGSRFIKEVTPHLDSSHPEIRLGAMVGLLRSGGIQGVLKAGTILLQKMDAPEVSERSFAGQVIGEVGIPDFYEQLLPLLRDANLEVRKTALHAAAKLQNPALWPWVIESLPIDEVRFVAASALISGGESSLPELRTAFSKSDQSRAVKREIVYICGQIKGTMATEFLESQLRLEDKALSYEVFRALSACGYRAVDKQRSIILDRIRKEIADIVGILAIEKSIGEVGIIPLLQSAFTRTTKLQENRLLLLLSFIYDSDTILRVQHSLHHADTAQRASALEVLDNLLPPDLKKLILPIFDNTTIARRFQLLARAFPQDRCEPIVSFRKLIDMAESWEDHWLEACAIYATARPPQIDEADLIREKLASTHPLVRETARWALSQLDNTLPSGHFRQSKVEIIKAATGSFQRPSIFSEEESPHLQIVEKVALLKQTSTFAEAPEDTLVEVATLADELQIRSGEVIIREETLGDFMYVIAKGKVVQSKENRKLNNLLPGQVFGNLSILDGEPYWSSVATVEESIFLRLDRAEFQELITKQPHTGQGIIFDLCRQHRQQLHRKKQEYEDGKKLLAVPPIAGLAQPAIVTPSLQPLLPIEKILLLKKVSLFSQITDEMLAEIVELLAEDYYSAGATILEKGQKNSHIYIIASGKVSIHDDDRPVAYLGERSFFGEIAMLDTDPQPVSVTAMEAVHLLRLNRASFEQLLHYQPELVKNVISVLSLRLRVLLDDLWMHA